MCPSCGGRRTEDDVRDGRCCLDCRKGKGTLGLLDAQFRTGSPELNSSSDWPAIKHFACKLFSLATFDANVLDRLKDWLQAEHHKSRNQMLGMQTSEVAATLRAACELTPPIKSKAPVAHRADEAFGIPVDTNADSAVTPDTSGENDQWFADDPPAGGKFTFGPLEGTVKAIAEWMDMDYRTIKRFNGRTGWWVKQVHGKMFAVWFSTQGKYAAANQKRLTAASQKGTK